MSYWDLLVDQSSKYLLVVRFHLDDAEGKANFASGQGYRNCIEVGACVPL